MKYIYYSICAKCLEWVVELPVCVWVFAQCAALWLRDAIPTPAIPTMGHLLAKRADVYRLIIPLYGPGPKYNRKTWLMNMNEWINEWMNEWVNLYSALIKAYNCMLNLSRLVENCKKLIARWEYPNVTWRISSYLFTYLRLSTDIHWTGTSAVRHTMDHTQVNLIHCGHLN